jgi:predicted PurR-regulated permease PerM
VEGPHLPSGAGPLVIARRQRAGGWPIAAVLAVVAVLLYMIRLALLPFVLGAIVGFVCDPLIRRLQERTGWRRGAVAAVLYLILLLLIGGAGYGLGRVAIGDASQLIANGPGMIHRLLKEVLGQQGIELFGQKLTADAVSGEIMGAARNMLGFGIVAQVGTLVIEVVVGAFLTLVLIPYFMVSGPSLARAAVWLIPPERRPSVEHLLPRIVPVLRRYLLGVVAVVCYTTVAAWIGYGAIFHLPHAVLLSIVVGLLEMIPAIGPLASGLLVAIAALQEHDLSTTILLVAYAIALRLSIDNIVGPLVLGQAVKVHPVVVIFSFVAGAILFGVIGLLLAVPVAACIRIILTVYYAEPVAGSPARSRNG